MQEFTRVKYLRIMWIYNIPYNPETIPIENVFGWLKNYVKRHESSTEDNIKASIDKYLKKITSDQLSATFNRAFNFDKYEKEYIKSIIEFN